ncbi:flagellar hook protein FlgE [Lysobacter korlensis]|uniref:Flagellar hook protein FlgE n=1 Tax=Lysobacter korlensis TaxID=553636 RepID=A0ABV6RW88_9GAMM
MLRSLFSGISGLRSHQTMLDVAGNNIANVNTTAFKASATQFQDTLSQMTQGAGTPQVGMGGTNPAQVGLGVQVAGISTNFTQGSTQTTGRAEDMMISGDGFFMVRSGTETLYTRAGSFGFDAEDRLVTPDGAFVLGWAASNGAINTGGPVGPISLPRNLVAPAIATTTAGVTGNLPADAEVGAEIIRDIEVFDAEGEVSKLTLTFTRTAAGWDVEGTRGAVTATESLTFTDGELDSGGPLTVGGITVNLGDLTSYAQLTSVSISEANGREAGALESYSMSSNGELVGSFSNGAIMPIASLALGTFVNPGGLEKAGGSTYRATANSGNALVSTPGANGAGTVVGGALEMSNVDLSQEFTNLIVAQRGFQANARIITTSDEVLQELTNLKR